jgi:hypothetical protein
VPRFHCATSDAIEITAQYFNKNYEFDEKARLTIAIINSKTKKSNQLRFVKTTTVRLIWMDWKLEIIL